MSMVDIETKTIIEKIIGYMYFGSEIHSDKMFFSYLHIDEDESLFVQRIYRFSLGLSC